MLSSFHILSCVLLCAFMSARSGESADAAWPCWRGGNYDGVSSMAFEPPTEWPKTLKVVWQAPIGAGFSSPVCDGSSVYLQSRSDTEELVAAYSLADGERRWQIKLAGIADPQTHEPAPTPSVFGGALYVHSMTGAVFKLDVKVGKTLWKRDLPAEWKGEKLRASYGIAASPVLDEKNILLPIGDKEKGAAVALKQSDGSTAWSIPMSAPGYASFMPLTLNGKAHLATLFFHDLAVLKIEGGTALPAFKFELPGGGDGNAAMPVPIGANRILITSHESTVALDVAADASKCTEAWRMGTGGNLSTPVFAKGRIYLFNERALLCLDPATGITLSSIDMDGQYCALLAWGDVLICRLHDGTLKFVGIQKEAMKLLADYPAPADPGESWSAPIPVAPNRIVVRTGAALQCLTWEK